jgi:phosphatidylserine/phosphatidylglycerophosphate/cardiolipin synthase-like enzyme
MRYVLILGLVFLADCGESDQAVGFAGNTAAASEDGISVYFSPQTDCRRLIINHIRMAEKTIDVQAYSFTSEPIARALVEAHRRGVKVTVILDADKFEKSEGSYLAKRGVATYVDTGHEKAHNKIVLIDNSTVITGSFNFAEEKSEEIADNLVVITGKASLARAYQQNFARHLEHSKRLE